LNGIKKAAEQGHASAHNNLAVGYKDGTGVEKDEQKAVELYQKAADKGMLKHKAVLTIAYSEKK